MRSKRSPFQRREGKLRVAQDDATAEILLYDEIGWFGVTAEDFRRELDGITAPRIDMRINSPGGDVFDSFAIYNALRDHDASVTSYIDGLAASMASVIALAGDTVVMAENAFYMVHNPWSIVIGNAADMRKEADVLDKVSGSMLLAYEKKTSRGTDAITAWMDDETWFTADEAAEAGFVDEITRTDEDEASKAAASFDLSIFANVPAKLRDVKQPEPTIRNLERALRDAGLSQIAAKQFIAAGRAAADQRDAGSAGERDVTPKSRRVFLFPGS